MVHKENQFAQEGEAQASFFLDQMESEQRPSWRILESVSQDRDFVRQEASNFWDVFKDPNRLQSSRAEVLTLTRKQ